MVVGMPIAAAAAAVLVRTLHEVFTRTGGRKERLQALQTQDYEEEEEEGAFKIHVRMGTENPE